MERKMHERKPEHKRAEERKEDRKPKIKAEHRRDERKEDHKKVERKKIGEHHERRGEKLHMEHTAAGRERESMGMKKFEAKKTERAEGKKPDHKGTWMKDGGMDREPRKAEPMKTWQRGVAQTITKGGVTGKPKSDGMHGLKMDAKAREAKGRNGEMPGAGKGTRRVEVHHYHHHSGSKGK